MTTVGRSDIDPRDAGEFYLPAQAEWMLSHFSGRVSDALRADVAPYWQMHRGQTVPNGVPDYRNQIEKDSGIALGWDHLQTRRSWFRNAINGAHFLGRHWAIDTRPLLRFNEYIHGTCKLSELDTRQIWDCLSLLQLAAQQEGDASPSDSNGSADESRATAITTAPPAIVAALSRTGKQRPLFDLLWKSSGDFVDWRVVAKDVWGNSDTDMDTMKKTAYRLNNSLLGIQGSEWRGEYSEQSGARIYRRTNKGQS